MICKLGCFVEFSVFGCDIMVDWFIIGEEKELDLCGVYFSGDCYFIVIDLLVWGLVILCGIVMYNYVFLEWEVVIKMVDLMELIKVLFKFQDQVSLGCILCFSWYWKKFIVVCNSMVCWLSFFEVMVSFFELSEFC